MFSGEGETQIALTFQHPAFTPVYTSLTIEVDNGDVSASNTYDIDSVYTYMIQQGGGGVTVDGTITAYSFYGYENLSDVSQVSGGATYTLYTNLNGTTVYYAEDETGVAYLTENDDEAMVFDAAGEKDCNVQLILNTLYVTTRVDQTETKTVDGQEITFTKYYNTRSVSRGTMEGVSRIYSSRSSASSV